MNFIEVKLNRTQPRNATKQKQLLRHTQKQRQDFPVDWNSHNVGYDSLKYHLREFKERKKLFEGKGDGTPNDIDAWEQSFSVRLTSETTKINSFYEERYNECVEGLRHVENELSSVCSLKSIESIRAWHEFINCYNEGIKALESGQDTPLEFISYLEAQLLRMAEHPIDQSMLNALKRLVLVHKLSLQLKKFALFNVTEFKKLLKKHDQTTKTSISTEWIHKLQQERFCASESFDKTVAITKGLIHSRAPTVDDFSCAICLGLLCKPVSIRCGHRFCKDCLTIVSTTYNFCPMCRMEQDLTPSNYIPEKQLKSYLKQYFPAEYRVKRTEITTAKKKKRCIIQ